MFTPSPAPAMFTPSPAPVSAEENEWYELIISTTTDGTTNGQTNNTIYASILSSNDEEFLVEQKLYTGITENETKSKTFSIPASYTNIKVKLYIKGRNGVHFSEVKITFNNVEHIFTDENNSINSDGVGVNNTVGWMDGPIGGPYHMGPPYRYYTGILSQ